MRAKDIVGLFKCPACRRICVGINEAAAKLHIAQCAAYVEALPPTERQSRSGDTPESLAARYSACGACGTPSSRFLPAEISDVPRGTTLQPIIAPPSVANSQQSYASEKILTSTPLPMTSKTIDLGRPLVRALAPIAEELREAFVSGPAAAGTDTSDSDIVLIIVGNVDYFSLSPLPTAVERELGHPIYVTIFTDVEWSSNALPALGAIKNGPRIDLMEGLCGEVS